jgi:hypothetical protein
MAFKWDEDRTTSSSNVITAEHVNSAGTSLSNFINQGIEKIELAGTTPFDDPTSADVDVYNNKGWVGSELIYRPEFYGSPSPRMMAVSGQTHFREVNNDWSKGVVFAPQSTGSGWCGIPNLATTVKLRHSATVNIMASFYCFEFGGVAKSQAYANNVSGTGTYTSRRDFIDTGVGIRYGRPGYFLKNKLEAYDPDGKRIFADQSNHGYESKTAGWVRLEVNGNRYSSTTRTIYTSHVDAKKPYEFPIQAPDFYGEAVSCTIAQNGYIFMPMIGRHLHHITAQVNLSEGVHNVGLCFKSNQPSNRNHSLATVEYQNAGTFNLFKGFPKSSAPKIPQIKNVFFLARNLVVDCYYNDNDPL